jgi:hypothetical protein
MIPLAEVIGSFICLLVVGGASVKAAVSQSVYHNRHSLNHVKKPQGDQSATQTSQPAASVSPTVHQVWVGGRSNYKFQFNPTNISASPNDIVSFNFGLGSHSVVESLFKA